MDGWAGGWAGEWIHGWVDELMNRKSNCHFHVLMVKQNYFYKSLPVKLIHFLQPLLCREWQQTLLRQV